MTRDTHTDCGAFRSGAFTTCFYDLGLSLLAFEHQTFRLREESSNPQCHRRSPISLQGHVSVANFGRIWSPTSLILAVYYITNHFTLFFFQNIFHIVPLTNRLFCKKPQICVIIPKETFTNAIYGNDFNLHSSENLKTT